MKLTAQDVMTRHVITVSPDTKVEDAATQLARHRITGLPVLDAAGSVIGMISDFDVIGKQGRLVSDIMTTQVISVSPDTDLDEIGHILTGKHIRRIPVVHAGKLVGVVSRGDLIQRIAQRWTCTVCGALDHGSIAPDHCAGCGADSSKFSLVDEPPMMYRDM
ncbi:MAG: domain containing rane protein [Chloroflexi bacterium]|jgi:CBS domain-containing protein|nr:domain containing rane protein [Chloroflexota bacterium]MDB5076926.1 domain containing rane protein [Chloroflexota bacterium]